MCTVLAGIIRIVQLEQMLEIVSWVKCIPLEKAIIAPCCGIMRSRFTSVCGTKNYMICLRLGCVPGTCQDRGNWSLPDVVSLFVQDGKLRGALENSRSVWQNLMLSGTSTTSICALWLSLNFSRPRFTDGLWRAVKAIKTECECGRAQSRQALCTMH